MEETYKYTVFVRCMTYNHSEYIEDAMNGFCIQETSFPYVCCIVDDCSNDGEQQIIKNYIHEHFILETVPENYDYGEVIFARHKKNFNCYFAVILLKQNHYSIRKGKTKYFSKWRTNAQFEAICEGDDYWIAKNKLQRQTEFLLNHDNYVLCTHAFQKLEEKSLGPVINNSPSPFSYNLERSLHNWFTQPLTALYRLDAYPSEEEISKYKNYMDNHLFYLILRKGLAYHIGECMGVYRITGKGVWTSISKTKAYKSDLFSYMELYRQNNDNLLRWKIASVYSTYLSEAIFNKEDLVKVPYDVLGIWGVCEVVIKTIKKIIFKLIL